MRRSVASLAVVVLAGCGVFSSDPSSDGNSDPAKDERAAEENAKPPVVPVGGPAPPGIYVSSTIGADDGSGSDSRPLKTLAAAFARARGDRLPVIACAEDFAERLTLLDGVSAYGYFDCKSGWKRTGKHAILRSPTSPAVVAKDLALPTRIEGFDVLAPDVDGAPATADTGTSIGFEVRSTKKLLVAEVLIHAGRGAPGLDGEQAPGNAQVGSAMGAAGVEQGSATCNPAVSNCNARKVVGPAGAASTCMLGPNSGPGGAGGDGTWWVMIENPKVIANPPTWNGKQLAASATTALGGAPGGTGATGAAGATGNDGANGVWSIGAAGFAIGDGTGGTEGGPGQGGGGGGGAQYYNGVAAFPPGSADYYRSSTGGSGGAGGCAGQPAKPGTGGGASIGMFVVASDVVLAKSRIESANGGRAGRGFFGGIGTVGGGGGAAAAFSGKGGDGGAGGSAGFSGHGAPGPSIALVYGGAKPALADDVALAPGPAGAGYPEQQQNDGARVVTLPAVAGVSLAEYVIP